MPGPPHQLEIIMSEGNVAADQLRLFIERIERLEEEKKGIADDIKDVYSEAKSTGYDTKTMRTIVRLRKLEAHARKETEAVLAQYKQDPGVQRSTERRVGNGCASRSEDRWAAV